MPGPATKSFLGVELVKAGTWRGLTGPVTITPAQIAAAAAAGTDPEVDEAGIRVGHPIKLADAAGPTGAPAVGYVENLRPSADGTTLLGDLVDIPTKLAELMPKAFRRRSAELAFGVKTPAGKLYSMTLTGLALLGITPPAVKGLADLPALYGMAHGTGDAVLADVLLADGDADPAKLEALANAIAAIDVLELDDRRRAELVRQLEDEAGIRDASIPAAVDGPRQNDANPPAGPAGKTPPPQEAETMDDAKLRKLLKLEEDADLEAEVAKLIEAGAKPGAEGEPAAGAKPGDAPAGGTPPAAGEKPADAPAEGELVGAGAPAALSADVLAAIKAAGVSIVSDDVLEELKAGAKIANATAAQLAAASRDEELDAAVRAGKITPKERDKFAAILEATPEHGSALLAAMTPRFATAELGADLGSEADESIAKQAEDFLAGLDIR